MAQLVLSDDELQATLRLGEGEALTPDAARVLLADVSSHAGLVPPGSSDPQPA